MAPKKKDDGLLGPDGRAVSQAFGGVGRQLRRYSDWRKQREARIQAQNQPTKTKTKTTKTNPTKGNNTAAVNARVQKRQQEQARASNRSGTGTKNSQLLRPAPGKGDPTPKKTPPKKTPPKVTPTKVTPTKNPPTSDKKEPAKKKPRTWLADNYKPGKGPARRSTPGKTNNKPQQSSRMRDALANLKVRKYKK